MGQKIAIMSDKGADNAQDYVSIRRIRNRSSFYRYPRIPHKPKTALGDSWWFGLGTLREVDVLFMVPVDEPRGKGDDMIIERLKAAKVLIFKVKIDKAP